MKGNRNYKDSVFILLFQDKGKLVELYNAIEGTSYTEETEIEINTLETALYMDMKNDISFLLDGRFIILVEHQSTINENMPLRFLLYIARIYEKLIDPKAIYKEEQMKIPTPEFIVLYNGSKEYGKETVLNLSDAFIEQEVPIALDLRVKVININYDKSSKILEKSRTLKEYSYFIHQVKLYKNQKLSLEEAVGQAIKDCIKQGVLEEFLKKNGKEVMNMLFTEFNLEDAKEVWQEEAEERGKRLGEQEGRRLGEQEGRKLGEQEGKKKAKVELAIELLDILDVETIAKKTKLSVKEIEELKQANME